MKTISKKCLNCEKQFDASLKEHNRGNAIYCSRSCSASHSHKNQEKELNCTCSWCGKPFYRNDSKKKNSKSGLYFCSRSCKDTAQRITGLKEIHPGHYDDGHSAYRELALREYEHRCSSQNCPVPGGYSRYPEILEVHHVDFDRNNNSIENLQLLCSTCHDEIHFLTKTGKWK